MSDNHVNSSLKIIPYEILSRAGNLQPMKTKNIIFQLMVFGALTTSASMVFAEEDAEVLDQANVEIQLETQETEDLHAADEVAKQDLFKSYGDVRTAEAKLKELNRKNTRLASQVDAKVEKVQKNRNRKAQLEADAAYTEKVAKKLETKVAQLNDKLANLETAKTAARDRVKTAQQKIAELKTKTREVNREIAKTDRQFQSFKKQQKMLANTRKAQAAKYQAALKKQKAQKAALRKAGFKVKEVAKGDSGYSYHR